MGNSEVYVEYQHWEDAQKDSQGLPAHVQKGYEKAQAAVKLRQAHEDAVASDREANADLLAAYMAYINLEQVRTAFHFQKMISSISILCLTSHQPISPLWDTYLLRIDVTWILSASIEDGQQTVLCKQTYKRCHCPPCRLKEILAVSLSCMSELSRSFP